MKARYRVSGGGREQGAGSRIAWDGARLRRREDPMGRRVPETFIDGQPRRFLVPCGSVVEIADETALVRLLLQCPHEGPEYVTLYDPGGLEATERVKARVCVHCGSVWYAGRPAPPRIEDSGLRTEGAGP
jgi:hypothetical protein